MSSSDILNALQEYRRVIADHNRQALSWFVRYVETSEAPEGLEDDEIAEARLEAIEDYLGGRLPDYIQTPADVMPNYDRLIRPYALDGTVVIEDEAERNRKREQYLDGVQAALRKKASSKIANTIGIPDEFRILINHVDALVGPGLPQHHERHQVAFFTGFLRDLDKVQERIKEPEELKDLASMQGWDVGAGWETGGGPGRACFLVYCRAADQPWSWRYIINTWEYEPSIHNDIISFLQFYTHFDEQDLTRLEECVNHVF